MTFQFYFILYNLCTGNYISAIQTIDQLIEINPENSDTLTHKKNRLKNKLSELGENPFDAKKRETDLMEKKVQSNDKPYNYVNNPFRIDDYQRNLYEVTCRGDAKLSPKLLAPLRCRYITNKIAFLNIAPFKMEEISLDPNIVVYHDVLYDSEIEMIKNDTKPQVKFKCIYIFKIPNSINKSNIYVY